MFVPGVGYEDSKGKYSYYMYMCIQISIHVIIIYTVRVLKFDDIPIGNFLVVSRLRFLPNDGCLVGIFLHMTVKTVFYRMNILQSMQV